MALFLAGTCSSRLSYGGRYLYLRQVLASTKADNTFLSYSESNPLENAADVAKWCRVLCDTQQTLVA
jgi:hypothetical protein